MSWLNNLNVAKLAEQAQAAASKLAEDVDKGFDMLDEGLEKGLEKGQGLLKDALKDDDGRQRGVAMGGAMGAVGGASAMGAMSHRDDDDADEIEVALRRNLAVAQSEIARLDDELRASRADADAAREDATRFAKQAAAAAMKARTTPTKEPKEGPSGDSSTSPEDLEKAKAEAASYKEKFAKAVKKGKGIALELDGANKTLDTMKQQLDAAKQEAETQRRAATDAYAEGCQRSG
jgi:hypothetical protein